MIAGIRKFGGLVAKLPGKFSKSRCLNHKKATFSYIEIYLFRCSTINEIIGIRRGHSKSIYANHSSTFDFPSPLYASVRFASTSLSRAYVLLSHQPHPPNYLHLLYISLFSKFTIFFTREMKNLKLMFFMIRTISIVLCT